MLFKTTISWLLGMLAISLAVVHLQIIKTANGCSGSRSCCYYVLSFFCWNFIFSSLHQREGIVHFEIKALSSLPLSPPLSLPLFLLPQLLFVERFHTRLSNTRSTIKLMGCCWCLFLLLLLLLFVFVVGFCLRVSMIRSTLVSSTSKHFRHQVLNGTHTKFLASR